MPPNPHAFDLYASQLLLLDFLVISVYHIIAVACLACVLGTFLTCPANSRKKAKRNTNYQSTRTTDNKEC